MAPGDPLTPGTLRLGALGNVKVAGRENLGEGAVALGSDGNESPAEGQDGASTAQRDFPCPGNVRERLGTGATGAATSRLCIPLILPQTIKKTLSCLVGHKPKMGIRSKGCIPRKKRLSRAGLPAAPQMEQELQIAPGETPQLPDPGPGLSQPGVCWSGTNPGCCPPLALPVSV